MTGTGVRDETWRGALRVMLAYAFFAALWVLLSDRAMGWLFVAVTSLLLYVLVWRLLGRQAAAHRRELELARERQRVPAMLAALADNTDDVIFAKDESGRFLLFNRAAARLVGKPVEAVLGRDDRALFPPEQAEKLMATDRRVMESGGIETVEEDLDTIEGKKVFLATKGPLRDSEGRVFGVFGISRDITARKKNEDKLRLWAEAFDRGRLATAIVDPLDDTFVSVNAAFARERGYTPEELPGKPVMILYMPEQVTRARDRIAALDISGHGTFEAEHLGKDGRRIPVLLDITVLKSDAGKPLMRVVHAIDITGRKATEDELKARNEELERIDRASVDRELRMIALKREVNALAGELGRGPPYDLSSLDDDGGKA